MQIDAIILAGGEGRRMGGADKALLPLGGEPLLARVQARIAPQVRRVAVAANGDPARLAPFGLPVLPDAERLGPLSGILSGLVWAAAGGADAVLSCPVDAPFVPADLAARLAAGGTGPAVAVAGGRLHHATALWPVALAAPLAAFLASGAKPRIADFAAAHGVREVAFADARAFVNLNTPADLARAEAGGS